MNSRFPTLSQILNDPIHNLFDPREPPPPGELQYCGPHFLAVISYALKLVLENTLPTFTDGLTSLNEAASRCLHFPTMAATQTFLNSMVSFLTQNRTEIRNFFVVPKLQQFPLNMTSNKVDIFASFVDFLVDTFQKLSSPAYSWILVPSQIGNLSKRLELLLAILLDMPFQFTGLGETDRDSILAEMESIANEAAIFLYSFFFTTDHVTMTIMDSKLSLLFSKLDKVEEKIKEHCVKIFEQQTFTTLNFTSTSIFIVDSLLDDLNHILNHSADLIVEAKDHITMLHEELYLSRSMLKDMELDKNKELIECEIQLINLAYQTEPIIARLVARHVPVWYLSVTLASFMQKSKSICAKLTNIKLQSGIKHAQVAESSSEVSSSQVATESIPVVDEIIVDFKEMARQIASQLIGEPNQLQIISIVGMGGLGKTTLARKLYNDSNVRRRFDKRCWCVVSQTYEKKRLMIDILSYVSTLSKDELSEMEHHKLADRLHKSLKGTRYLLVVDDIWKKEAWDDLRMYFPNDNNGSRILFTTRNKDVAVDSVINELPLLTDGQCWDLLHKKVFPNSLCPSELQDVGKKISKNCKGLPLTVVGIAAVLANMEKKEELWQEVASSLSSYNSKGQDILELSYKHLPSHLKPCFLYLGKFREDEEIPVKELLSLWISLGFIPRIEDKNPEAVAEDYLLELINRTMVQVGKTRANKGVKTCTIHDLIREMCIKVAEREDFFELITDTLKEYSVKSGTRMFGEYVPLCFGNLHYLSFMTSSMIRLKILKLLIPRHMVEYDGTALEHLLQLRHLECAGKLRNFSSHMKLEFLSLVVSLDTATELNMPRLRHLHFRVYQRIPDDWYNSLSNGLETLSRIIINDLNDEIRLKRFSHLRRLRCRYDSNKLQCPDLGSFSQLVSLYVAGFLPHDFEFFTFPVNIKKLSILRMPLTPKVLLSIGELPNLEILKMKQLPLTELCWDMSEDLFKKLKFLKLEEVSFNEWNTTEYHFPYLEHLVLVKNHFQNSLPSELGYIPTMKMIEVDRCPENIEMSAREIMKQQQEAGNEQLEVIITGYRGASF